MNTDIFKIVKNYWNYKRLLGVPESLGKNYKVYNDHKNTIRYYINHAISYIALHHRADCGIGFKVD